MRSIIFTEPPPIQRLLSGQETLTLRVMKPQPTNIYRLTGDRIRCILSAPIQEVHDGCEIGHNSNLAKRRLQSWERWQNLLADEVQRLWEKGVCGLVSASWSSEWEGIPTCILMPSESQSDTYDPSTDLHVLPRDAASRHTDSPFEREHGGQSPREPLLGDGCRELAGSESSRDSFMRRKALGVKALRRGARASALGNHEGSVQPTSCGDNTRNEPKFHVKDSPLAKGIKLWIKETYTLESSCDIGPYDPPHNDGRPIQWHEEADGRRWWEQPHYKATDPTPELCYDDRPSDEPYCRWCSSQTMPRWASRLTVRLVRDPVPMWLWDIVIGPSHTMTGFPWLKDYFLAWDRLNAKRGYPWSSNPWVWARTLQRVEENG